MATYYFWDEIEDNVTREYDENNNTIANYTTEPTRHGSVVSQERGGVTSHYHFDGQRNTTELTNESGNVTDTRRYSAFGEVTANTGTTVYPFMFVGKQGYYNDASVNNIYVRRREYTPARGRWSALDPAILTAHYLYVANNSPNGTDPTGLIKLIPVSDDLDDVDECSGDYINTDVAFLLDHKAPCDGYIVQFVEFYCKRDPCPCELPSTQGIRPSWTIWEMWPVTKNAIYPDGHDGSDDRFTVYEHAGECGYVFIRGTSDFYCKDIFEDHPPGLGAHAFSGDLSGWEVIEKDGPETCNVRRHSGASKATEDEVKAFFWKTPGGIERRAVHTLGTKFKCCPCQPKKVQRIATPRSGSDI